LSIGERTIPRKIEPPTHIEAQIRCSHMIRASTIPILQLVTYNAILFMLFTRNV